MHLWLLPPGCLQSLNKNIQGKQPPREIQVPQGVPSALAAPVPVPAASCPALIGALDTGYHF